MNRRNIFSYFASIPFLGFLQIKKPKIIGRLIIYTLEGCPQKQYEFMQENSINIVYGDSNQYTAKEMCAKIIDNEARFGFKVTDCVVRNIYEEN